ITNTRGESSIALIRDLGAAGIKINVTAILALDQVRDAVAGLAGAGPAYVSVFAGRIADTGRDPVPLMAAAAELVAVAPNVELIWASPRELLNIYHADAIGCHIITVTHEILDKLDLVGKDLRDYSLETDRYELDRGLRDVTFALHRASYQAYMPDFSRFIPTTTESAALLFELAIADRDRYPVRKIVFASSQAVSGEGAYLCPSCAGGIHAPSIHDQLSARPSSRANLPPA